MNFSKRNKSIVDFMFIMALFGAFAITGLLVVLFGARVYQSTISRMDMNYSSRTALSYVTEKIRAHDFTGGADAADVGVASYNGQSVLLLNETVNDRSYVTYLYVEDGILREFTAPSEYEFRYDQGTEILPIKEFRIDKKSDALYEFNIIDGYDNSTQFFVTVYSGSDGEAEDEEI